MLSRPLSRRCCAIRVGLTVVWSPPSTMGRVPAGVRPISAATASTFAPMSPSTSGTSPSSCSVTLSKSSACSLTGAKIADSRRSCAGAFAAPGRYTEPRFRGDHHEGGFAPTAEERLVIPGDAVAQPLAGGAPIRPVLIVEVHLGIVGIDAGAFDEEALVEI